MDVFHCAVAHRAVLLYGLHIRSTSYILWCGPELPTKQPMVFHTALLTAVSGVEWDFFSALTAIQVVVEALRLRRLDDVRQVLITAHCPAHNNRAYVELQTTDRLLVGGVRRVDQRPRLQCRSYLSKRSHVPHILFHGGRGGEAANAWLVLPWRAAAQRWQQGLPPGICIDTAVGATTSPHRRVHESRAILPVWAMSHLAAYLIGRLQGSTDTSMGKIERVVVHTRIGCMHRS